MKTQSRAFRTSDWAEGSPFNRTMILKTQQEWVIDNSVNVLEWPSQSKACTQSNISGETWKCESAPIQPDRAWEVKRWGEQWQIIAKFWCVKLVVSYPKRLEAVRVVQLSTKGLRVWILMQCAHFSFFCINLQSCDNSLFALSLWCMECGLSTVYTHTHTHTRSI